MGKYIYVYAGLLVIGLVGGYIYWHFWGCTDSCPMDSDWRITMTRGGLIGLCAAAIFHPRSKKKQEEIIPESPAEDQDLSE